MYEVINKSTGIRVYWSLSRQQCFDWVANNDMAQAWEPDSLYTVRKVVFEN